MMTKRWILAALYFLMLSSAHADLQLIKSVTSKEVHTFLRSMAFEYGDSYTDQNGETFQPTVSSERTNADFAWMFNKQVFYTNVSKFPTDKTPPLLCQKNAPKEEALTEKECDYSMSSFEECHLFLFNPKQHLIGVQQLHVLQSKDVFGKPSCQHVDAVAPAAVAPDAILVVLTYTDSFWQCAGKYGLCSSPDESGIPRDFNIPLPVYKTTFLIRFSTDASGKIVTRQDDTCMPPLNKYASIASARKALKQAGPACTGGK